MTSAGRPAMGGERSSDLSIATFSSSPRLLAASAQSITREANRQAKEYADSPISLPVARNRHFQRSITIETLNRPTQCSLCNLHIERGTYYETVHVFVLLALDADFNFGSCTFWFHSPKVMVYLILHSFARPLQAPIGVIGGCECDWRMEACLLEKSVETMRRYGSFKVLLNDAREVCGSPSKLIDPPETHSS
ncbi:hypothetical protein BJY00DRAFT_52797 [Aspergillus carlsbadensis]|nr:hypothetical protein BJY00DRAFT_52797 [Aspergillus carlsbadensis]